MEPSTAVILSFMLVLALIVYLLHWTSLRWRDFGNCLVSTGGEYIIRLGLNARGVYSVHTSDGFHVADALVLDQAKGYAQRHWENGL